MKGKGKKGRESSDDETSSCPLKFIDFKELSEKRSCNRLNEILVRNQEEGIGMEDLDALQSELESLLVSVVQRQRLLNGELESLTSWQDIKPKEKKSTIKPEIFGKRNKLSEEKLSKRVKESTPVTPVATFSGNTGKSQSLRPKSKNPKMCEYPDTSKVTTSTISVTRNDVPDKFWTFIEPYCSPLKTEHLKQIEEILKTYDDDSDYTKVPNLGKHYTLKWSQDDRRDVKKDSKSGSNEKKRGLSPSNSRYSKKNKDSKHDPDKCSFGALTQRLVSCLMDENLYSSPSLNDSLESDHDSGGKNGNCDVNGLFKSVILGNTSQLEKRIRKELEEQGVLDADDNFCCNDISGSDEDEILKELKHKQAELKHVSTRNQQHFKRLLGLAKNNLIKQEHLKNLEIADTEVLDVYRKIVTSKQKKRSPSKKEKEVASKVLREREIILKQIDILS